MTAPVVTIDAAGAHAPDFATILNWFRDQYRSVYGADVVLDNDTQDGQWLGIQATALSDANAMAVAIYNAWSVYHAQGAGLSTLVKINGITRHVASASTVDVRLIGQTGTTITNGVVSDASENRWLLPESVVIPLAGEITVTATCARPGAVVAPAGTITIISTPSAGWQSVTNPSAATPGDPVETDAELKLRQSISTAIPALSVLDGLRGAIAAIPGVRRSFVYENDSDVTDANGLPGHTISVVVDGGDSAAIAEVIRLKKTPGGCATFGDVSVNVVSAAGIPSTINFFRLTLVPVTINVSIRPLRGFTQAIEADIEAAVVDWVNALDIGEEVNNRRLFTPANLNGAPNSKTYEIVAITARRGSAALSANDVAISFKEAATTDSNFTTITIVN